MSKQATLFGTGGRLIVLDNGTTMKLPTTSSTTRPDSSVQAFDNFTGAPVPPPQPETLLDKVRSVMSDGAFRAAFEIQREVDIRYGTYASESSIAARIRELRQSPLNLTVLRRRAPGKRYFQFALEGE